MKKLLFCTITCLIAFTCGSWTVQAGDTWKIGHVRPTGSAVDKDLKQFTEAVKEKSGSAIQFSIYPANKLGDYSVVQEKVAFGEVEMFLGPIGTTVDKRCALAWTPFLVTDWEQAEKMYSIESPIWLEMDAYLGAQNLKLVGGWPVYFGGIGLTDMPGNPADPDIKKGTIIRIPPIRGFESMARELGFTPYPITWKYAKMGLKTGLVGGLMGGGAEGYAGLADNIRYYLPVKDHFEYWFLYINLDLWNSLSAQHKMILTQAARTMEEERYKRAEKAESDSLEDLISKGITVIPISAAQYSRMREKAVEKVWPQIRKDAGKAFEIITNSLK